MQHRAPHLTPLSCSSPPIARMAGSAEEETVQVHRLHVEPNICKLEEPLHITMEYSINRDLQDARWEIKVRALALPAHARAPLHALAAPRSSWPTRPTNARS